MIDIRKPAHKLSDCEGDAYESTKEKILKKHFTYGDHRFGGAYDLCHYQY